MAEVVEVGVVGEGVAEVDADGVVDLGGALVAIGHEGLDVFEFFGEAHFGVFDGDAGGGEEAADGLLGEVLDAAAVVAGPFVGGGVCAVVDGGEGEFVEPGGDVAFGVDVAGGGAGAEGEAEDGVDAEGHGAGEGGDLAVVGDFEGDAVPGFAEFEEDVFDVGFEIGGGDAAEKAGDFDAVVDVNAGAGAADGVDAGEVRGGAFEGVHDFVEVPAGIFLGDWIPDDFFGEDGDAILDGGDFAIGAAEVEADAAAVEVAAEGRGGGAFGGELGGVDDFEGFFVDAFAHDVGVELAGGGVGVVGAELVGEFARAVEVDAVAAAGPEEEFGEPFDVEGVGRGERMVGGGDDGLVMEEGAVGLFDGEGDGNSAGAESLAEGACGEGGGAEAGVEGRRDSGRWQGQMVVERIAHWFSDFRGGAAQ